MQGLAGGEVAGVGCSSHSHAACAQDESSLVLGSEPLAGDPRALDVVRTTSQWHVGERGGLRGRNWRVFLLAILIVGIRHHGGNLEIRQTLGCVWQWLWGSGCGSHTHPRVSVSLLCSRLRAVFDVFCTRRLTPTSQSVTLVCRRGVVREVGALTLVFLVCEKVWASRLARQ